MKIFVISDIHGSINDLNTLFNLFEKEKADLVIIAGDYLNHGPRNPIPDSYNPKEVANLLNQYSSKIFCIKGNCDSEVDKMLLNFPFYSDYAQILLPSSKYSGFCYTDNNDSTNNLYNLNTKPNGKIFIHHGHKFSKSDLQKNLSLGSIIISGHTHVPELEYQDGYFLLNPGSISLPKNAEGIFNKSKTFIEISSNETGINKITLKSLDNEELKYFEWWDLFSSDGKKIICTKERNTPKQNEYAHTIAEIITVNQKNEYLLTLRSKDKPVYPGYWEITGGSILSGESSAEGAIRELKEETGIIANINNIHLLQRFFYEGNIYDLFINKCSDKEEITLQKGETDNFKWISKDEFVDIINNSESKFCDSLKIRLKNTIN